MAKRGRNQGRLPARYEKTGKNRRRIYTVSVAAQKRAAAMNDNRLKTIEKFYTCFRQRDAAGMCACYHPDIAFSDPVFGALKGKTAFAMWHMLTARAENLTIRFSNLRVEGDTLRAHWEADYPFSRTGRTVHNVIEAAFLFQDELIIRHDDTFDIWRWQRMALGPLGTALGWTPFMKHKLRATARAGLDAYISKNPQFKA